MQCSSSSVSPWGARSPRRWAPDDDHHVRAARPHAAGDTVWGRSRDHQRRATVADLFTEAGLDHDPPLLPAYREFWDPRTLPEPQVVPLFTRLRGAGVRGGVLDTPNETRDGQAECVARG